MLRWFLFLFVVSIASAGPIGNLRTKEGVMIRCEVYYVDENFYYCKRVAEPKEALIIPIENVPQSFRRHVAGLQKKGELTAPPPEYTIKPKSDTRPSSWKYINYDTPGDRNFGQYLHTVGRSNRGFQPRLYFRFRRNKYEAYIESDYKVTFVNDWQITYVVDDKEPVTELFRLNSTGKALFVPRPFNFGDQLKGGTNLLVTYTDYKKNAVQMLFDIRGFEAAIEQIDSKLNLPKD